MILNNKVKEIDNDSLFYLKKLELKKELQLETPCFLRVSRDSNPKL